MHRFFPLLLIACQVVAGPAPADEKTGLWGRWGTPMQCRRDVLLTRGTKRAEPVDLSQGWLKQGQVWCALTWFPVQPRDDGLFVAARALCGEDSQNAHSLALSLIRSASGDELTLIWNESLINGPMFRCPPPD